MKHMSGHVHGAHLVPTSRTMRIIIIELLTRTSTHVLPKNIPYPGDLSGSESCHGRPGLSRRSVPSVRKQAVDDCTHRLEPLSYLVATTFLTTQLCLLMLSPEFCSHLLGRNALQQHRQEKHIIHGFRQFRFILTEPFSCFPFKLVSGSLESSSDSPPSSSSSGVGGFWALTGLNAA